jgi:hypothetical protein
VAGHLLSAALLVVFGLTGCGLDERGDFLVGRVCVPEGDSPCDVGQVCLPHVITAEQVGADFRCRDAASFVRGVDNAEPPLAYCDERFGWTCPQGLRCEADRVRDITEGMLRRTVCVTPNNPFGPI